MWFFEDVAVDHGALARLHDVALFTAARLQQASQQRPMIAAHHLARCAGPFADDLANDVIRLAARHAELAEALLQLAASASTASVDAQQEQARRVQLRVEHESAQAARALAQAASGAFADLWGAGTAPTPDPVPASTGGSWVMGAPL